MEYAEHCAIPPQRGRSDFLRRHQTCMCAQAMPRNKTKKAFAPLLLVSRLSPPARIWYISFFDGLTKNHFGDGSAKIVNCNARKFFGRRST